MRSERLDKVCDFISGLWAGKTPPYIRVGVIRNTNFHISGTLDFSDIAMLDVEVKQFNTRQLQFGDIVLEKSGGGPKQPVGRVCVFEKKDGLFSLSNFTSAIRVKNSDELDYRYLHYFLRHLYLTGETEKIQNHSTGIRNLQLGLYKEFSIPLPPIATQQKIVVKLDAIFAEIDKATAAAEANIKNAEALFQSYLNQVFEVNFSNKKKLKDCCLIKPPKSEAKALNPDDEVSFMPMEAMGINEKFAIPNQVRKLSDVSGSYTYFAEGDVLLAKITPCFENGKLGIAKDLTNRVGFGSSEYIVFRPGIELDSSWLYYFLNRSEFRNNGAKHMSGAVGHKRITKEFIEDSVIPLPPILRQSEIISEIENISNITKSLKSTNSHKLIELNQLKQSILNQAFNGELVKE